VGNLEAIRSLYETGIIFHGDIEMPILDIRDYMEPILDMHNAHQSFATRQRILNEMGTAEHQTIWFSGIGPEPYPGSQFNMRLRALKVMDEWMGNILRDPKQRIVKTGRTRRWIPALGTRGCHCGREERLERHPG